MNQNPTEDARVRRGAAARVARDFAVVNDLAALLAIADRSFAILFDGGSTIQVGVGDDARFLSEGAVKAHAQLDPGVAAGLAGQPSPDVISLRPGILLVPQSSTVPCRAWVRFETPRRISADEMIVADLLAQAFALAVDRVIALDKAARQEDQFSEAIEGQRAIGQAVGILVERHKILPEEGFERLRTASQNANIKLREIARRMVETGEEPEQVGRLGGTGIVARETA